MHFVTLNSHSLEHEMGDGLKYILDIVDIVARAGSFIGRGGSSETLMLFLMDISIFFLAPSHIPLTLTLICIFKLIWDGVSIPKPSILPSCEISFSKSASINVLFNKHGNRYMKSVHESHI